MNRNLILGNRNPMGYQLYSTLHSQNEYVIYGEYNCLPIDQIYQNRIKSYCFESYNELLEMVNQFEIDTIYYLDPWYIELDPNRQINTDVYLDILQISLKVSLLSEAKIIIITTDNPFQVGKITHNQKTDSLINKYAESNQCLNIRSIHLPYVIPSLSENPDNNKNFVIRILLKAIKKEQYISPIPSGTFIDIIYIYDAINAIIKTKEINPNKYRTNYSFTAKGLSVDPETIYAAAWRYYPDFDMIYKINNDEQQVAIDKFISNNDLSPKNILQDWELSYTTKKIVDDLIFQLRRYYA